MLRQTVTAFRIIAGRMWISRNGNVAMMFALVSIPLIVSAGGLLDMSRTWLTKSDMQDALDGTALMLSREAPTMTQSQMERTAEQFFYTNFNDTDVEGLTVAPSYSAAGPSLTVAGTASVKMYFLGLIGIQRIPVSASATVVWGETRLRVSLVLDNTGSMASDGKMAALKTATHNLLAQLRNAAGQDGDVYVSIVPFSKNVNAGSTNYAQPWVRWDLWDAVNGTCSSGSYTTAASCAANGKTWTHANHDTWNGCVTDRDQNYDTLNTAPSTGTPATLFPAEQYANCPTLNMGLSYDWQALANRVDAMQPNGLTNQAIGLQWGWQSLTNAPFAVPPVDGYYKYRQVIILLTDGLNTRDRWYSDQSSIDARQKIMCDNVKAAGISVYTVQVNTGGDPTSDMLRNCASDPSQFFLLTNANEIVSTFESIGTALAALRVSG